MAGRPDKCPEKKGLPGDNTGLYSNLLEDPLK